MRDNVGFEGTMRFGGTLLAALLLAACAAPAPEVGSPVPEDSDGPPAAPWSAGAVHRSSVPPVYVSEWERAENREACALLALPVGSEGADATPRRANFSGGWAVAYDLPELRSAFGVAGTGSLASDPAYAEWPHRIAWADGSTAGYGPEGGTGPNQLAYLEIAGQECLYNVWSRIGRAHLEHLLGQLRFVEVRP